MKEVPQETPAPTEAEKKLLEELNKTKNELLESVKVADQHKKGLQTLERELRDRESKLKQFGGIQEEIQAIREDNKLLAGYIATLTGKPEDDFNKAKENKPELLEVFNERERQRATLKQQKELIDKTESFRQRVEESGYTRKDDEYWQMYDLVISGKFNDAEERLKLLEEKKLSQKEPEKTEKKETEEEKINRLAEEKYQKRLESEGLLKSDVGTPSGKVMDYASASIAYAEGRITPQEFLKYKNK